MISAVADLERMSIQSGRRTLIHVSAARQFPTMDFVNSPCPRLFVTVTSEHSTGRSGALVREPRWFAYLWKDERDATVCDVFEGAPYVLWFLRPQVARSVRSVDSAVASGGHLGGWLPDTRALERDARLKVNPPVRRGRL